MLSLRVRLGNEAAVRDEGGCFAVEETIRWYHVRMFRRLSVFVLTICIPMFLGTLLFWGNSYFVRYNYSYFSSDGLWSVGFNSGLGGTGFGFSTYTAPAYHWMSGWISQPVGGAGPYIYLRLLLHFEGWNQSRVQPGINGGFVRDHYRGVSIPIWCLLVLWGAPPTWIFMHRRRKTTWALRKDVAWTSHRLRVRIARFALFSVIGIVMGSLVAWLDRKFDLRETPWEWALVLLALIPVVSLSAVFTRRRIPWRRAILWMALELAGCLCFFEATVEGAWNHFHVYLDDEDRLLEMILFAGLACFMFGGTLLLFLQVKPEKVKPGPYCPECGYCLIGLPRQICSECGRAFTLKELGVGAEALIPRGMRPA